MKKAATFYRRGLEAGASDGSRTRDLMITSQVLYQLSYAGNISINIHAERKIATAEMEKHVLFPQERDPPVAFPQERDSPVV